MEDVLTSNVLSIFRYLNNMRVPTEFLRQSRNINGSTLNIGEIKRSVVYFWPYFCFEHTSKREADALLVVEEQPGNKTAIVVEAKYLSGLSNYYQNIEEYEGDKNINRNKMIEQPVLLGHQLADEYCGVTQGMWQEKITKELEQVHKRILLYITSDYETPLIDFREAISEIGSRKYQNSTFETELYWIGWRNLHTILKNEFSRNYPEYSNGDKNFLEDLRKVLEQRKLIEFKLLEKLSQVDKYTRFHNTTLWITLTKTISKYQPLLS